MRKLISFLAIFLTAVCVWGDSLNVPALSGRIIDTANIISPNGTKTAEQIIKKIESQTGGQVAVLTVKSLGAESIEDYSMRVAETWKIGKKGADNGLIILVVPDDHAMRIEVGYGWEGAIPDSVAMTISQNGMAKFKQNDFDGGIALMLTQVEMALNGEHIESESDDWTPFIMIAIFIVLFVIFAKSKNDGNSRGSFGGGRGGFGGGRGGFSGGGGSFGGGGYSGKW